MLKTTVESGVEWEAAVLERMGRAIRVPAREDEHADWLYVVVEPADGETFWRRRGKTRPT